MTRMSPKVIESPSAAKSKIELRLSPLNRIVKTVSIRSPKIEGCYVKRRSRNSLRLSQYYKPLAQLYVLK